MTLRVNLATRPYANRRLLSIGLGCIILICGALVPAQLEQLESVLSEVQAAKAEVVTQQSQMQRLERQIPAPVPAEDLSARERDLVTAASSLIERRVFPWTRLLADLERHMGQDVRLTQISVALLDPSRVDALRPGSAPMDVSMVVIGRQLDVVLEMLRSLQATGRFDRVRFRKQTLVEGTQEIEYEVEMVYTPR